MMVRTVGWAPSFMRPVTPVVAPAGQVAEVAIGAAVVGGLAFAGWLASKAFNAHPPAFQARVQATIPGAFYGLPDEIGPGIPAAIAVTPQTISLMQAQLHWMGTHGAPPILPVGTAGAMMPDVLVTVFSPSALAAYAAVRETGQIDDATIAALAHIASLDFSNINANSTQATATFQRDPTSAVIQSITTQEGQQQMLNAVDLGYRLWTDATQPGYTTAPKAAGQATLPPCTSANSVSDLLNGVCGPSGSSVGSDRYGQCTNVSGSVIDASGNVLGAAGQLWSGASICDPTAYQAATGAPAPIVAPPPPTIPGTSSTTTTTPFSMTPDQQAALINSVAGSLGTSVTAVTQAIASGDRATLDALANAARLQVAAFQTSSAQAQAQGSSVYAALQAQRAAQMQQFAELASSQSFPMRTVMIVVAGVAALGILAAVVYASTRPTARANPARVRRYPRRTLRR